MKTHSPSASRATLVHCRLWVLLPWVWAGVAWGADQAMDSILAAHENQVRRASLAYDTAVKQADQETVARLTTLMNARTKSGDLDGALAVKKAIEQIVGNIAGPQQGQPQDGEPQRSTARSASSRAKSGDAEALLEKRYIELHKSLITTDLDGALKFIDPHMIQGVTPANAKAYLGILAFGLKLGNVTERDVKITKITIGMKGTEARVEGRLRLGDKWQDQKPMFWVQRDAEWYLGDERELTNFR